MAPASDVVLMLAASLRQSFLPHHSPADQPTLLEDFDDHSGMDPVSGALALRSSAWIRRSSSNTLFATSLQVVLKGLIEFILNSSELNVVGWVFVDMAKAVLSLVVQNASEMCLV